jgi:hypothetical protein
LRGTKTRSRAFFEHKKDASEAEYESWRRDHTKDEWWVTQEMRKDLVARFGVCCLSEVDDNHLMWSHYASDHQGFCVGLDETQLDGLQGLIGQGPVKYQSDAPRFRYYIDPPQLLEKQVFACKSKLWEYEREYRIGFNWSGIVPFPKAALKQII